MQFYILNALGREVFNNSVKLHCKMPAISEVKKALLIGSGVGPMF